MILPRTENTPEGSVVSLLLLRYEEQMKIKKREGKREKRNERSQVVKTLKDIKWKRGEFIVVESEKTK